MSSTTSPAYSWYPKDILASARVSEMTANVECWYRRALDYCWINRSLPADPAKLATIIGKGCTKKACKDDIIPMFVPDPSDPSRIIHDRQMQERAKQERNTQARRDAANSRWDNHANASAKGYANASPQSMQMHVQPKENCTGRASSLDVQNDALHIASSIPSSIPKNNDDGNNLERAKQSPPPSPPASSGDRSGSPFVKPVEELAALCEKDPDFLREAAMRCNILPQGLQGFKDAFPAYLEAFMHHLRSESKYHTSPSDFRSHFKSWLPKRRKATETNTQTANTQPSTDEYLAKRKQLEAKTRQQEAPRR